MREKKGIIFIIDVLFAVMIALSFIYIIFNSHYNIYTTVSFEDPFPYDIVNVYEKTHNIDYIRTIFEDKGYSGQFENLTIGNCEYNNEKYVKKIDSYRVIYCRG